MASDLASTIVAFWKKAGAQRWYAKDPALDAEIRDRFEATHHAAARNELTGWMSDWQGSLALLLLLDQFPRNIWRGSAHAFATDPLARQIARAALEAEQDRAAPTELRVFFYLPFEHSEQFVDQQLCLTLCEALDHEAGSDLARWARLHHDIIARFGRFPHRNRALGRASNPEEQAYLDGGGFTG